MEKNQTAHMLTHFTKKSMAEHRQHLKTFVIRHKDWIGRVGEKLLAKKGHTVDEYVADMVKPGFKFDEIALLCFARMHHKHVFILMEGHFWTTRRDTDVAQCYLKFGFIGNLLFVPLMHESVVCRCFPDDTRCVNLFLPKHCSLRQIDRKKTKKSCPETTIKESSLLDEEEYKLHSDLRECVNDVFEAILGQSPPHIPNGTIAAAAGATEDTNSSVLKMPEHPSGSNDGYQDSTVVGTIWMDSTDSAENSDDQSGTDNDQNGTESGTERTPNAVEEMDATHPDSTVFGTDQSIETELRIDNEAYNLELNQAVASIDEHNMDMYDVNTPAVPGLVPENNEIIENVNNTVGTMPPVQTAEMNNHEDAVDADRHVDADTQADTVEPANGTADVDADRQAGTLENVNNTVGTMPSIDTDENNNHADTPEDDGIPSSTDDADNVAGTLELANDTVDVDADNRQPRTDSDFSAHNNNNYDTSSDSDSVHTSGYSTCPSSISSSESCPTDCTKCDKDEKTKHKRKKRKKKGKKRCQSDDSYPSGYESSSLPRSPNAGRKKLHKTLPSKPNYKVDVSTTDEGSTSDSGTENAESDKGESEESEDERKRRFCTKIETKVIKTKDGQLSVRHDRLKGKKIRMRNYKCKLCSNISQKQKEHNEHMRTVHKNQKFVCFHCSRVFTSDSALYKHE